jgi:hypothetical protein
VPRGISHLTPEQRSTRTKIAANARWAKESGHKQAVLAQAGLRGRFVHEVREQCPNLNDAEIARRAEHAFIAHMSRLALKSSKARTAAAP